jgi:subtilisin family serine protease
MIDSRLRQVMSQLKENIRIPVIVELSTAPTPAAVQELRGAGLSVTTTSKISPLVYGTATDSIIQAVPLGESVGATGAPALWEQGITGKGVKVGVIDTGVSQSHSMISPGLKDTFSAVPGEGVEDENHHGCLSGDTIIITDEHGVTTLEELWDATDIETTPQNGGEVKSFSGHTIGMDGVTPVSALYRTHADEVAIIDTGYGIVKSTVWHKFFVGVPRKDPNRTNRVGKKDTHPRWYHGYDVIEKRADELKQGDCLVCAKYSGTNDKLWNNNIDPKIAYIAGLVFGDGTILTGYMYKRYRKEIRIFDNDLEALQSVKKIAEELGATAGIYGASNQNSYVLNTYGNLAHTIKDLQFNDVCNGLESIKAWVAGFFDAEGYVSKRQKVVVFSNTDLDMLVRLNDIFKLVGLRSYINSGGVSRGSQGWHLCVTKNR